MKNKIFIITLLFIFTAFFGCASKPEEIDSSFLVEKTAEDEDAMSVIQKDIIVKKQEQDVAQKALDIAEQKVKVSKAQIAELEAGNLALLEQEKLYSLTADNDNLNNTQSQIKINHDKRKQADVYSNYLKASRDEAKELLGVKAAELSVKVAELDYRKATVAKKFQLKRPEKFGKNGKPVIDEADYETFVKTQKADLEEANKKHDKAKSLTEKAKEEIKKSGYQEI